MNYLQENEDAGRVILPDLVRAFALLGIVLVNVAYFAYPSDITYHAGGLNSNFDNTAYFGVNALFLFKSYTLFSFMFGVGLAQQMMSAKQRGIAFLASYFRRLMALIVLGILHVSLGFSGDILIIYGTLGALLFLLKNKSQKILIRTGIALIIIQVLVALIFSASLYLAEEFSGDHWQDAQAEMKNIRESATSVFATGNLFEIAAQRWRDWLSMVQVVAPLQGPGVLGFFLLGLAAVRSGVLSEPESIFWVKARRYYLGGGILLSAVGSTLFLVSHDPMSSTALLGYAVLLIAAPFSSIGYIGLIAKWSAGPMTPFKLFIARGGTSSLSAYLLQSLILSLIFCGYGLGYYRSLGAFECVLIASLTGIFTISFASIWRIWFKRGPMEGLLRSWTYLGQR